MHIQYLLLPNWCQIHNTPHSEFSCAMCKIDLNQIHKRNLEVLTLEEIKEASPKPDEEIEDKIKEEEINHEGQVWTLIFDGSKLN